MALILSRKVGEAIWIAPDVVVQITEVKGDRVKVGITAPRETRVLRNELKGDEPKSGQFGVQTRPRIAA
jgi:carbon storage regulator